MKTRQDAIAAIRTLRATLEDKPDDWENQTLERFLDAMAAWIEDSGEKLEHIGPWDLVIRILEAGKIYE